MIWQRVWELAGIALLAAACVSTASPPLSPAERCVQDGGRWRTALELCEGSGGGGGGGGGY